MANQKRVQTSYDSGGNNTAKKSAAPVQDGDWGGAPKADVSKGNDKLLDIVMEDYRLAKDYYKRNYKDKHDDYWKCYNSIRTRRGYEGISDDFVPEAFTIIESVKANVAGGKPRFNFMPMREEQKQDTEVLNELLDYYWDCNRMTQKTLNWVQDMLLYGNGILFVSWEDTKPRIINIPLSDFFVDPTATHFNHPEEPGYPKYAGYEYLTDKDALKNAKLVDPETGEMTEKYKNIDEIEDFSAKEWEKLDKETKEGFIGSTLGKDAIKTQVRCIVYYTKKKKIIVANGKTIIYEGKNPYQRPARTEQVTSVIDGVETTTEREVPEIKPFLPFAILRNYVDSSLFYAMGDMEVILDSQEALNDVSNQKRDNLTYNLNNMWQIDPQFAHLKDQIESLPGAVYPIPRGALAPIEKAMIGGDADNEMLRIKDEMRRATAADEVIQGVSQDKGRVTATEVTAQLNQASQRFSTKLQTLEDEGYAQLGRILFKMIQIFVTTEIAVRVVGSNGVAWRDFDPNEYTGDYEPKVTLLSTQKAIRAEEGQKYLQVHQIAAQSPFVDQMEFMRIYFEKVLDLPDEEIKRLIKPPQVNPNLPPMPPGMAPGGGTAPAPASGVPSSPMQAY